MEVAFKFVERAIDFVLEASIRRVGYIFCYNRNVEELRRCTKALEDQRKPVDHKIQDARRNGENIYDGPQNWCHDVEEKIKDSKKFQDDDETHKKTGCSRSILFLCYRHKLGRKAYKMAEEVKSLTIDSRQNGPVGYKEIPKFSDTALSTVGYVDIESRRNKMEEIMKQLEESTVRMIGVHGPSGVGKTTFVKKIAKKARDKKLFGVVITVDVKRNPDYEKIQKEIAYHLGLTFGGEGENVRADRLRERLKQEKENTLIILDDLWDTLDLRMLGVSFDDDDLGHLTVKDKKDFGRKVGGKEGRPSDFDGEKEEKNKQSSGVYKGCKILLTSRVKEVFDKMKVEKNSIFCVERLDDQEAETLFKKVVAIPDGNSKFKAENVKYCAGLPMMILSVGMALRNKSESEQEYALEKFKIQESMEEVQKHMEISVEMNYDHLETEELKSIFLLCAQMCHEPLIEELVKYCYGLGILQGVHKVKDARDRISHLIKKLKNSCWMLDGDSSDHFNMHDMVRDAALSIAHKYKGVFTLRNDKLEDWPDKDELESFTAISIYKSDIVDELPEVINCPQLRVFHIDHDDPSLNIPDRFFEGMENLRVLILTGIDLPSLPSSIKRLSNLRMLCLERCELGNLSIIGDLKKLRILSLSGSKIENWPAELGVSSKLQLLDISHCSIGNSIPYYFISSLTNLEELYIGKSLITMKVEGETKQSQISVFSQLKHLHELKIIDVCIPSADVFPTDLLFDKLDDYKIVIGDFQTLSMGDFRMPIKYEASRSLALRLKAETNIHSLKGVKMLFKRVENLLLGELNGVRNVVCELNLDGFPDLKILSIINGNGIEYIVNSMELSHPLDAFPKLESLSLFNLMNMKKICRRPVTVGSFSSLKTIKVKACRKLKNLFSSYMVKFLVSLETIDVSECDQLKEIVESECDQLKEIVDEGEVSEKIEFRGLCSMTLQDLPSLTSFYANDKQARHRDQPEIVFAENEQSFTTYLPLFGEKVEIPNLESLNLSSIKIHKIWSDQFSSFSFQNLIKLVVKDCCNLTYLCSLSVASNLKELKGLFVSDCKKMETLFITEGDSKDYSEECIFPKLEEIKLIDMDMLKDIWPAEVSAGSFPSLISVSIASCSKLGKIFPSHMNGRYGSLDYLNVAFCESVEVIFEIRCPSQEDAFGDTKLQLIDLTGLPNLKQVWSTDLNGVVNFTNLRSISVASCDKLSCVLPSSVAKGLAKLEDLTIQSCDEMGEIVAGLETNNERLVFHEITSINFDDLQNMSCFYKGRHPAECPKLKRLAVTKCPKLETFTIESANEEERPVFLAEKVISNLEYLKIGQKEAEWLKSNIGKYRMHRLKHLCLKSVASVKILYWPLHRIPNLERLELSDDWYSRDSSIRELVPSGNLRLEAVWQLKELTLSYSKIEDIGFERDPLLQRIERLVIHSCDNLIKLAHHTVSFTQLTYLEVSCCDKLKKLMAASTAKSLVRLTTMKVTYCRELEEIVTNDDEGNEEEKVVGTIEFGKLITIELARLRSLTCFCSYKNCDFSFPLLEKLILRDCPKMKKFNQSPTRAPKLQNVLVLEDIFDVGESYWEGDLNATIQKVFDESNSRLKLSDYPELEQVWCGKELVPENSFRNLKTLVVGDIGYLVHVIPSHLLPWFKNLQELEVYNCDAVQVIFNINDNGVTKAMGMFRFKKLSLRNLPRLEHVWDRDPEGIIGLEALRDLSVQNCKSLKYVFPASVAKELGMLEKLSVEYCEQLVEIFAKDIEIASEGDTKSFVFHSLTSLELRRLPELKCFYPGLHNLEFPVLEKLHLPQCKWEILTCQEAEACLEEQVLVAVEKVNLLIHNLRKLSFDMGAGTVTWDLNSKKLELRHLLHFSEQSDGVLYRFLQTVPNIEKLEVRWSSLKEMFFVEKPNADYAEVVSHLKGLNLDSLDDLKSIGLEHCWIHPFPESLRTLQVERCDQLKNLVPAAGTVSFSNLTDLVVYGCRNLLYLFTSSTAKSLARLERMEISECESMQEIVSTEGDESQKSGQIIFGQLQSVSLKELPMLRCFYLGNYTLCFPSLEEISVTDCLLMKTFCPLITINQDLVKLFLRSHRFNKDVIRWEGDIDTTIRKMNEKKTAESARELIDLSLGDEPHIQELWRGSLPVPDACFSNLESLVVDGCEFLSEVLPSNLLPFLTKMHKLEVRNCCYVKTIFDVKCIKKDRKISMGPALLPLPFSLKTLVLKKLPNLKSVWNEDPDGVLRIQLQEVCVDTCKCLTSLFSTSVANDLVKLENLVVKHCEQLVEIFAEDTKKASEGYTKLFVFRSLTSLELRRLPELKYVFPASVAKELGMLEKLSVEDCKQLVEIFAKDIETASEGDTKSFVFRSLTSLWLRRLPELKCFYPGLHNLEFPALEELYLHRCKWVILSCLGEQVLVAVEKVNLLIRNLKKLSFDMRVATVTWDLKSKKLGLGSLQYFSEQSDGVLYRFLQMVPDVEKLEVSGSFLKEMFSAERPNADYAGVLSHLKELRLRSLHELKSIGLEHSWIHPIPENLQTLRVKWCDQLKNLVPAAGTASFSNLTDLVVSHCRNLLYLFTSSTAKSLARLERMEISKCESMQEIVSTESDESHESGQIIFEQLQSLSLEGLPILRCVYSGNYALCFPSLETVSVTDCLLMKTFCPLITINQDLVKFSGSEFINEDVIRWEGDIGTAIRKMNEKKIVESARELRYLSLGNEPHIQEMWHGSLLVPDACFNNLESLVVEGCEFLSEVLPSNLLPFLNKMHKLEVRNCSSVKTIFDVKCIKKDRKMSMGPVLLPLPFSLKTLVLKKLPNLESVWNEDPDGVLRIQLQEVRVDTCKCLTSLFPTSVANDLVKLENLVVKHCEGLVEIVAGIEALPEGTNLEFTFPCLTSLMLLDLPMLKCFYCSLCCVQLKRLDQDPHIEDQGYAKEITPNLDNLSLGEKELKMIWNGQCQGNHLHKIKVLDLQGFNVESNEFPYGSLQKVPNIEELVVSYSSFKEIFCAERPNVDSTGFLSRLKGLKLDSLPELISIGLEHPWVEESFVKELKTLEATSCPRLRNLVPSSICFSSLMRLTVSNCEDMIHLFNTSTAISLAQLKLMDISNCKTIQEIVSKEGGESHHDEIVFGQLQELKLEYLPNLESFYKGSLTLSFPSLEKLSIINCSRMDTFCVGSITANKLLGVQFRDYDDLNFTILKAFKAQLAEFVEEVEDLELVDKPEVHAIWHGSFPVPLPRFISLKSLIVERCEFLSTVIPSHILGLLCKLEELVVRKCHSVKTIFEVRDTVKGKKKLINAEPAFSPSFRLKKLTFEQLPNLEHVWDSDPQEVIGLQNLQQVYVNGCDSLERLFPAPVAKRLAKLEKLEVQRCGRLVEIVAKDEAAKGEATKEFVMPCVTSVKLWFLPELECFYPGPHKLECPKLTQVHLFHCDKLKTFTCESQSLPEAQSEYQVGIPLNPQALFLADEVIPCLEFLAINKEMAMLIWHGQFHAKLLHKLKTVQLQCFHDGSDTFPFGLLQKVPNTEKLVVSCSSFEEIFSSERPTMDCAEEILSHVKCLKLSSMAKLNSIGLEHSWVDPISENLEKLQIDQCHCLRNIVPCKVSFSNLIDLNVSQCGGLASLFTPSTSRTLSQLKNMSITNCESLEEIVSEGAAESSNDDEEQITFHKLETLSLHSLPRLGRFYGGSVALRFPSLDELSVINCRKMESFCGGASSVNVNRWTTFIFNEDQRAVLLIVDLNSAIRKAFEGTPLPRWSPFPMTW